MPMEQVFLRDLQISVMSSDIKEMKTTILFQLMEN